MSACHTPRAIIHFVIHLLPLCLWQCQRNWIRGGNERISLCVRSLVAQFHSGVDLRGQFKLNFPNKRNFVPLNSLAMLKNHRQCIRTRICIAVKSPIPNRLHFPGVGPTMNVAACKFTHIIASQTDRWRSQGWALNSEIPIDWAL